MVVLVDHRGVGAHPVNVGVGGECVAHGLIIPGLYTVVGVQALNEMTGGFLKARVDGPAGASETIVGDAIILDEALLAVGLKDLRGVVGGFVIYHDNLKRVVAGVKNAGDGIADKGPEIVGGNDDADEGARWERCVRCFFGWGHLG